MRVVRPLIGAMALAMISQNAFAKNITVDGENKGDLDLMVKVMHVVDGKENNFDPNYGTSTLLKMKYTSPSWNGLKFGVGFYSVGELIGNNPPANTAKGEKLASGMFANTSDSMESVLGEAHLKFKSDNFNAFAGRMIFKSPLTTAAVSTLPTFHTAFGGNYQASENLQFGIAQITQISLGARAVTEFGLIGEGTKTAGTSVKPQIVGGKTEQATFLDIDEMTAGGSENNNGISALSLNYKPTKATNIDVWNYYADNISNTFYVEAKQGYKLANKSKVKLMAQFLNQKDVGDFSGNMGNGAGDIDYNLFGVKAVYATKGWKAYAAFNKSSGDTAMLNAWSGDPAYTSSMFSRNAYRENVTAFKVGGMYKFMPKWALSASYANYSKSDTNGKIPGNILTPMDDANEVNVALTWKPIKKTMLKLVHSNRTSEYDGFITSSGKQLDRTQSHTRLIGVWKF